MENKVRALTKALALGALVINFGACFNKMPRLHPPRYNAAKVAKAAVEQYDSNTDGVIDAKELKNAPSIRFAADRIDGDGDGKITEGEFANFVQEKWLDSGAGGMRIKCAVTMDGVDLADAKVTFEPEEFLGGVVGAATGRTDMDGFTPISDPTIVQGGVRPGLYLVRITIDDGKVPAKYNTETTLGVEVARRASYMPGHVEFQLSSR